MDATETEIKAMLARLVDDAINRDKLDGVKDLFAPHLAGAVRQGFASFRAAFPDWREEIVETIIEGDRVALRLRCSGTFSGKGAFMGLPPNGSRQQVDEVFFLRVEAGRFVEWWGLEDNLSRLQQLGAFALGRHRTETGRRSKPASGAS